MRILKTIKGVPSPISRLTNPIQPNPYFTLEHGAWKARRFPNIAKNRERSDSRRERETLTSFPESLSRGGSWAGGKKITVRMEPFPSLWGSYVNVLECFGRKTTVENWLQTERLSDAPDCNISFIVGEIKLPLSFIFLFIVDRIKVKI